MIHEGDRFPVVVELTSKKAPTHWLELICANWKSAVLIVHVFPPNENVTVTFVEQAVGKTTCGC